MGVRVGQCCTSSQDFQLVTGIFANDKYALFINHKRKPVVLLHEDAAPVDELRAFYHARALVHLHRLSSSPTTTTNEEVQQALVSSHKFTAEHFPDFLDKVKAQGGKDRGGWDLSRVLLGTKGWRVNLHQGL